MWFGHRGLETARPKVDAGMQFFSGDQSKQCACARPLEYRDRTSSNPSGIFSHRSGISTTFVSCARRGGRCACFWTAPGDHMRRPPRKGRTAIAEGCHAHLRQRAGSSPHERRPRDHCPNVFPAQDQHFHVAGGGHVALLHHHGVQGRGRWNTSTGFRSTCGASARAKEPGRSCERPRTSAATSA